MNSALQKDCAGRAGPVSETSRIMTKNASRHALSKGPVCSRDACMFGRIVGASAKMKHVYRRIGLVADTKTSIIIEGESGTGKELVAREIHDRGTRSQHPFITVNCAAIPPSLFESELFGHERGAFTGAAGRRRGKFEHADRGTIFLDEVAALHPEFQAKLLRVLESGTFTRLGGNDIVTVDVRVLCASNISLISEVREGRFREDLFHRLNGVDIQVPPLRERGDDILILIDHFRRKFSAGKPEKSDFGVEAIAALREYRWPGNVRELKNVVERALVLADSNIILKEDLQLELDSDWDTTLHVCDEILHKPFQEAQKELVRVFQQQYVRALLNRHEGDVTRAAEAAGMSRQMLVRMRARNW